MNTVDANVQVCTRCQMAVNAVAAPVRQRRSVWWSRRGGIGLGAGGSFTPGKYVCSLCGSGSLVPAGTPRGQKILGALGIGVTGRLRPAGRTSPLAWIILAVLIAPCFIGVLFNAMSPSPGTQSDTPAPPSQSAPLPAKVKPAQPATTPDATGPSASGEVPFQPKTDVRIASVIAWQMRQASNGMRSAQCDLGLRYLKGDGVAWDTNLARYWLEKSAAQDCTEAKVALQRLGVK